MAGNRIGRYIQAVRLVEDVNFMSSVSNRYKYKLEIEPGVKAESAEFKKLAYDLVFTSTELNQLEYKGDYLLTKLWGILSEEGGPYALLPTDVAEEIKSASEMTSRKRLLCDYIASLTDGSASRLYKRMIVPDFGSIGDLVG